MTEDCRAIDFSRQENGNDELPMPFQRTHSSIQAQRDHRKRNSGHALRQALSLRKMRVPILRLVNRRESDSIHHANVNRFPSLSRAGR
jgi:hypothetical protein